MEVFFKKQIPCTKDHDARRGKGVKGNKKETFIS
jgi:hypothetical protein